MRRLKRLCVRGIGFFVFTGKAISHIVTAVRQLGPCRMCIFCIGDDAPFYLRKSTAFPRKLIAEAVEADIVPCEKVESARLESAVQTAPVAPTRTPGPGHDDNV
jgi:hypothetical protein